jgi:hypothetical protein
MKLFKLISVCVISVLLVISITLNIFLLSGFKITKEDSKNVTVQNSQVVIDTQNNSTKDSIPNPNLNNSIPDNSTKCPNEEKKEDTTNYLYKDNNIKVTYLGQDKERVERTYLFYLENLSTKTVNVLFTDIYVDGKQLFISGLSCENLLPETSRTENFILFSKEVDQYSKSPTTVTFKIKLVNSNSYLDLYESDQITLTF